MRGFLEDAPGGSRSMNNSDVAEFSSVAFSILLRFRRRGGGEELFGDSVFELVFCWYEVI